MRKFFYGTKFKIAAAICVSLMLGIFIAAVSDNGSSPLSSVLSVVTTPLGNVSEYINRTLGDFKTNFVSSASYKEEIAELTSEIEEYKSQLVDYEKIKHKLSSYEAFLEIKEEHTDYSFLPASVILRDAADIYSSFTVNKGSKDGVAVNQPVIYGKNLVGITKEVSENSTVVYSVFNPAVSISAYEIRTREDCYTEASSALLAEKLIRISGLSRSTPIVSGGIICTSGIGGIYPRDLIIGTVERVIANETDVSAFATVKPDVDISSISDVFIITDFSGKTK